MSDDGGQRGHGYRDTTRWGFHGPECRACGGVRAQVKESGYTDDGLRIRRRACLDCGQSCASVEVYIDPELTTYARLDGRRMRRQRERQSAKYHKGLWRVPQRWVEPDRLRIRLEVRNPKEGRRVLPDDLLGRVCRAGCSDKIAHKDRHISEEGWVVAGSEAFFPDEWAAHTKPAMTSDERREKDRERKRLRYATDPEFRRRHLERVRLQAKKRRAA